LITTANIARRNEAPGRLTLRCTGLGAATCGIAGAVLFRVRLQAGELGSVRRLRMRILPAFLGAFLVVPAVAQSFKSAHIVDGGIAVHGVTTSGQHKTLHRGGRCRGVSVSSDQHTVAWFQVANIPYYDETVEVFKIVRWFRDGKVQSSSAGPFAFRRFWFVDGGRRIGVNLGAMHGPGVSLLLDALTGKELASFPDADLNREPTPKWMDAGAGA